MSGVTCEGCKFFSPSESIEEYGDCRRNAPPVYLPPPDVNPGPTFASWPVVHESDWCGEWADNEIVQAEIVEEDLPF